MRDETLSDGDRGRAGEAAPTPAPSRRGDTVVAFPRPRARPVARQPGRTEPDAPEPDPGPSAA